MRVWVFVNVIKINGKKMLKAYLFKHGYSRLASVKYNFAAEEKIVTEKATENNH
jgi:hypothetical protein